MRFISLINPPECKPDSQPTLRLPKQKALCLSPLSLLSQSRLLLTVGFLAYRFVVLSTSYAHALHMLQQCALPTSLQYSSLDQKTELLKV